MASLIVLSGPVLGMKDVRPVSTPIDLRANATTSVEFKAANNVEYDVEIEMDQQTAKRLFPCAVDMIFDDQQSCAGLPVELQLRWTIDGVAGPYSSFSARDQRGGTYGGEETYSLPVGYKALKAGHSYALSVRATRDATVLLQAQPRLVVRVSSAVLKDEAVFRFLALSVAAILILFAAIWAGLVQLVRVLGRAKADPKAV